MRPLAVLSLWSLAAVLSTASAQAPRIANALPLSVDATSAPRRTADPVPDTTAPWRYYPLAIGNVWEYDAHPGHLDQVRVIADTVALGHRYFILESATTYGNGALFTLPPVRFDTASATLRLLEDNTEDVIGCPFDAPFGATIQCGPNAIGTFVEGTHDGVLVFGGVTAGTGKDTIRTAVKEYENWAGFFSGYAAGFGEVYSGGEGTFRALRYVRINGVEYGSSRFPTAPEPPRPEATPFDLRIWPNPTHGSATVTCDVDAASAVRLAVYDRLGREVAVLHDGPASGPLTLRLDAVPLPAGVYAVQASTADAVRTARFTVAR